MELTKQTVYLPVSEFNSSERAICTIGIPDLYGDKVIEKQGYFFTPEQLNEYTQAVIRQTLETAAERAKLIEPAIFGACESNIAYTEEGEVCISSKSIINTFEETFNKFKM